MSRTNLEAQLREAGHKKLIIQFARPFEPGTFTGYVMDVGSRFFLLAVLSDGFEFEQYSVLRIADIRGLESPAKRESFYKAARKLRGDKMPSRIKIDLSNMLAIIGSLHRSLLTFHRENISPDTCKIGRVISTNRSYVELLEIDPDGEWETEPSYVRLNQVTRIDLPGPYEKALLLVGGESSAISSASK